MYMTSEDWDVIPSEIQKGESAEIRVSGQSIFPEIYRDVSCGAMALEVDEKFTLRVRSSTGNGDWMLLENPKWDWDKQEASALLPSSISKELEGWVTLEVQSLSKGAITKLEAFWVTNESRIDTDSNSETDSTSDTSPGTDDTETNTDQELLPYCRALPALSKQPTIDGILENGFELEYIVPVGWGNESVPMPEEYEMSYVAAWYNTGIYFFLEVVDPDRNPAEESDFLYMGDSVEIYVDHDGVYSTLPPNYDAIGTRELIITAPANNFSPSTDGQIRSPSGVEYVDITGNIWTSIPTDTGYAVEILVIAENLGLEELDFIAGDTIGFDLSHNVSFPLGETGDDGNRLSQYYLKIREPAQGNEYDFPWRNESVFCTATLLPL